MGHAFTSQLEVNRRGQGADLRSGHIQSRSECVHVSEGACALNRWRLAALSMCGSRSPCEIFWGSGDFR
jgi:hypothetical protein